ncbi:hypothetical protein FB45DRAFT_932888 [Roridomyces roridus]|uniref:F-box domain-containing protein n=1 Tax=Roridomyces roridus TaxID=1738132 RepID=A0AAD7BDL9_9AGAR|nr:hypothetical protein FB45DRAFT_932888 [Roridomyces roridus]
MSSSSTPVPCPINILFPEILCYIFTLTVPPLKGEGLPPISWKSRRRKPPTRLGAPWSLVQICSTWRIIALEYAPLWSTITLSSVSPPRHLRYLDAQIERAGAAPLDILVRFTGEHGFGARRKTRKILNKLVERRQQWRSLHLEFVWALPPPEPFKQLGSLPMLEEIIISGRSMMYLERTWEPVFANARTPKLRKVVLGDQSTPSRHVSFDFSLPLPSPHVSLSSWAELLSYKATFEDPTMHFTNLSRALNLVECDIDFGEPTCDIGVVSMLKLRRLVITSGSFLPHLIAPALLDLHVHGERLEPVLP